MRRRAVLTGISSGFAWSLLSTQTARSAQTTSFPVIGWLHSGSAENWSSELAAFHRGLLAGDFRESRDFAMDYQWADNQFDLLPRLASGLISRGVSIIACGGGDVAALAAKGATTTVPIVFAIGADPVAIGVVASLNRPGQNITGASFLAVEIRPKMLDLIGQLAPEPAPVAVLVNPKRPDFSRLIDEWLQAAHERALSVQVMTASNGAEIDSAFIFLAKSGVKRLVVLSDPVYFSLRDQITKLANLNEIISVYPSREYVTGGGLISYGAKIDEAYEEAGAYVARILKGENAGDLPVIRLSTLEMVINLKAAKSLRLEISPTLLAVADEVIE